MGDIVSFDGGIVEAFEAMTGNNGPIIEHEFLALRIENAVQSPSAIRLNNVDFHTFGKDLALVTLSPLNFNVVSLINSKDIFFGGCRIYNINNSKTDNKEGRGGGIALGERLQYFTGGTVYYRGPSSVIVGEAGNIFYKDPNTPHACATQKVDGQTGSIFESQIFNVSFGIYNDDWTTTDPKAARISVSNTWFKGNFKDISVEVLEADIHDNQFGSEDFFVKQSFNLVAFDGIDMRQIELKNSAEVIIYHNDFYSEPVSSEFGQRHSSILISNVGGNAQSLARKVLIRWNTLDGDINNLTPASFGIKANGKLRNFEWTCNTFKNYDKDVSYSGTGPHVNPFSNNKAAGNVYSSNATYKIENLTMPVDHLLYRKNAPGSVSPVNDATRFSFINTGEEGLCEIKCAELDQIRNNLYDGINGVEPVLDDQIIIYPNPTSSSFDFSVASGIPASKSELIIISLAGSVVKRIKIEGATTKIDVSDLPSGFYFVKTEINNTIITSKIIIAR